MQRSRSGCLTCRERKVKCDEQKPGCENTPISSFACFFLTKNLGERCTRAGHICKGYPTLDRSEPKGNRGSRHGSGGAPAQSQSAVSDLRVAPLSVAQTIPKTDHESPTSWLCVPLDGNQSTMEDDLVRLGSAVKGVVLPFGDAEQPPQSIHIHARPPRSLPSGWAKNLPLHINGINSAMERKYFYHFIHVTSRVLTLSHDERNPFLDLILARSLADSMVSKALSCLGRSDLAKLQGDMDPDSGAEQRSLLAHASSELETRSAALKASGPTRSVLEFESVLISALLLYLYEISEGRGDRSWQTRLEKARDLVGIALAATSAHPQDHAWRSMALASLGLDPVLLDFFVYHDVLAAVTNGFRPPLLHSSTRSPPDPGVAYMIGVNDGLSDLIVDLTGLRTMVAEDARTSARVVCKATQIWARLHTWQPKTGDQDLQRASSAYISALFVWLYSIIYPDDMSGKRVQVVVRRGLDHTQGIQYRGPLSCLLFPAFVLGFACTSPEQRAQASALFERLQSVSNFRNITLAQWVVQQSWNDFDNGARRTWDWIQRMEAHQISFAVA
jgi:hypothetical protein